MQYYSINRQSAAVSFKEAAILGQAPDKGLYFPEKLPQLSKELIDNITEYTPAEIAFEVIHPYIGGTIPDDELRRIVNETISFIIPLVPVTDKVYALELFHGPTLAFKDIGARFMSRCLGYFLKNEKKKVTVLVATSGDTGGAVANGFYGVEGVEVVILYPSGKVSPVQEKQLTTLGKNIKALEINGTFDDCQQLVKQAFADEDLRSQRFLTSANSINIARWLPQQFYYFFAYKQWIEQGNTGLPVISVPSGNFGNICAGILAANTGLPLGKFIAACNINDIVSDYLQTGTLVPKKAEATLSNAMDVGNPSNFVRIIEIFGQQYPELKKTLFAATVTDEETEQTIARVFEEYGYVLDPHGAVAYRALKDYLSTHADSKGIFLETAHPVKFPEAVERNIGTTVPIPESIADIMNKTGTQISMEADYELFKRYLLQ